MAKMGRKPKDGVARERLVTFKLSEDEVKRIDALAEYLELPKSVFTRNLVLNGLKEAELYKKLGFLKLAKGYIKTSDFLNKIDEIKDKKEDQDILSKSN